MQFTIAIPLIFATLGLAAPTAQQKRATGQVTLFKAVNYGGQSTTLTVDTGDSGVCQDLPSSFNNQVLSVRLNPTGGAFHCRLFNNPACAAAEPENDTWAFNNDVPNLGASPYTIGNKATSIYCAHSS